MKVLSLYLFFWAACLISPALIAQEIKIPVGNQTPELQNVSRPNTGMLKASVKQQYGEPLKENPAKGKPPISSWEYTDFIVYFENDHVIHSVLKPKQHESKEVIIETEDVMSEDELKAK